MFVLRNITSLRYDTIIILGNVLRQGFQLPKKCFISFVFVALIVKR